MSGRFEHRVEHKLESKPADNGDGAVTRVRRLELITGTGRRRQWSANDKARIVVESLTPGANVSEVARRHGLSPQQLFACRRQAREAVGNAPAGVGSLEPSRCPPARSGRVNAGRSPGPEPAFAPVVMAAATSSSTPAASLAPPVDTAMRGLIEIAISDVTVRVSPGDESSAIVGIENSPAGDGARPGGASPARPGVSSVADHWVRSDSDGGRSDGPARRTDDDFGSSPTGIVDFGQSPAHWAGPEDGSQVRGLEPPAYGPRQAGRPSRGPRDASNLVSSRVVVVEFHGRMPRTVVNSMAYYLAMLLSKHTRHRIEGHRPGFDGDVPHKAIAFSIAGHRPDRTISS